MIVRRCLHIKECRIYAYAGQPNTCYWCGYTLKKLWWHKDYKVIGSKDEKLRKGPRLTIDGDEDESFVPRPIWEQRDTAPDRGRGLVIDAEALRTDMSHANPYGNNFFCSFSCATLYSIAALSLGCRPEPIALADQRKIRALFRAPPGNNRRIRQRGQTTNTGLTMPGVLVP